jgi:hypothetical protein
LIGCGRVREEGERGIFGLEKIQASGLAPRNGGEGQQESGRNQFHKSMRLFFESHVSSLLRIAIVQQSRGSGQLFTVSYGVNRAAYALPRKNLYEFGCAPGIFEMNRSGSHYNE